MKEENLTLCIYKSVLLCQPYYIPHDNRYSVFALSVHRINLSARHPFFLFALVYDNLNAQAYHRLSASGTPNTALQFSGVRISLK